MNRKEEDKLGEIRAALEAQLARCTAELAKVASQLKFERDERGRAEETARDLERRLFQARQMDAVGRLSRVMLHDFNNLLTVIVGNCELLLLQAPAEGPMRDDLEAIKKAGERAASLTRGLQAFSKKQIQRPEVLSLNTIVDDFKKMLQRVLGEDILLHTSLAERVGAVKADPGRVERLMLHLALRARGVMPGGGKLIVETDSRCLDEAYCAEHYTVAPGDYEMLTVRDTGDGLDAQTGERILKSFREDKCAGKDTDVDLASAIHILKELGGALWVSSEAGKGTTFRFYLPRVDAAGTRAKGKSERNKALKSSETILLAEDDAGVRKMTRRILDENGYNVLEAADGIEAIKIGENCKDPIDLMLADVVMPEMSGGDLAREFASRHPETKILYMSAHTDDTILQHGLLDEKTAFLRKPFTREKLLGKLRSILGMPAGDDT